MASTLDWYFDNLVDNLPWERIDKWASTRGKALRIREKYGIDIVSWRQKEEAPDYVEGKLDYTNNEKQLMADELLREDSKRELCRECLEDGHENPYGEETGQVDQRPLMKNGKRVQDEDGNYIMADYPELRCSEGHTWWFSEGKARGIDGENPVLFEEHLQGRRKREIYTQGGTPDPSIVSGIYNRVHPQGRKVNSPEQRKKNGASFYR